MQLNFEMLGNAITLAHEERIDCSWTAANVHKWVKIFCIEEAAAELILAHAAGQQVDDKEAGGCTLGQANEGEDAGECSGTESFLVPHPSTQGGQVWRLGEWELPFHLSVDALVLFPRAQQSCSR